VKELLAAVISGNGQQSILNSGPERQGEIVPLYADRFTRSGSVGDSGWNRGGESHSSAHDNIEFGITQTVSGIAGINPL
jgi:hypothetical protein